MGTLWWWWKPGGGYYTITAACVAQRSVFAHPRGLELQSTPHQLQENVPWKCAPSAPPVNSSWVPPLPIHKWSAPPPPLLPLLFKPPFARTSCHFKTTMGQRGGPHWGRCRLWSERGRTVTSTGGGDRLQRSDRRLRCGACRCPTRAWC